MDAEPLTFLIICLFDHVPLDWCVRNGTIRQAGSTQLCLWKAWEERQVLIVGEVLDFL